MTALFPLASLLGAVLLFLVQPLMARQVLPWFGGAAAVWTVCLVFFQTALVLGYLYAHASRRLGLRWQVALHAALLLAAAALLPIEATRDWQPSGTARPVATLLGALVGIIGAPYVLLAATAPILQDWYAQGASQRTPYRLYVYSNIGSLVGLLIYPFVLERLYTISSQARIWSTGYVIFLVLCVGCGWRAVAGSRASGRAVGTSPPPSPAGVVWFDRIAWFLLSACGSGLLLSVTNLMVQDIASIPLLWILPLALYLVTFILCFAGGYRRRLWLALSVLGLAMVGYALVRGPSVPILVHIALLALLLVSACMVCHGELVRLAPASHALTTFYVVLAAGGAAGGMFVALAAPILFTSRAELPLLIAISAALVSVVIAREHVARRSTRPPAWLVAVPAASLAVAAFVIVAANRVGSGTVAVERSFYGILRVLDDPLEARPRLRRLLHGSILHGAEALGGPGPRAPITYYSDGSGIDVAVRANPTRAADRPIAVGVIGLGTGTIAVLARAGDRVTFFELDPHVVRFAREYFSFLRDTQAAVDVVLGDARLSLERRLQDREAQGGFDVFAVDAFSGDSVPVHLLTREAFALYRRALAPDGVLAVHVSNLHLDLEPVVRGLAADAGWEPLLINHRGSDVLGTRTSDWMLLSSNAEFLAQVRPLAQPEASRPPVVWTDQFSSLISVLK